MIACILCGGVGELMLVMAGFTWLLKWLRKRHDKNNCKCCQSHEQDLKSYLIGKGYCEDMAQQIDYGYREYGMVGVRRVAKECGDDEHDYGDDEHDYTDEFLKDVKEWQTDHFISRRYGEIIK